MSSWWTKALIQEYLKHGGDFKKRDDSGHTSLIFASKKGEYNLVKRIIEKGVDISQVDYEQRNALFFAIENKSLDIALFLIESGINIFQRDSHGMDLLQYAALYNQTTVVIRLIELGLNIDPPSNEHLSALSYAVTNNNLELVQYLVEKGANVNFQDHSGRAPLPTCLYQYHMLVFEKSDYAHLGSPHDQKAIFNLLLAKKADINLLFNKIYFFPNPVLQNKLFQKCVEENFDSLHGYNQNEWKKYRLKMLLS